MRIRVIKPKEAQHAAKSKVCAYVRVSTDSVEQEGSLENQTQYFTDYINANPEWEFSGIYADQGISGFKEERPGFQQMITDARLHKIDLIIVKSVSRFARNTETVLKISRELKSTGVGIFFQLQNINTLSETGELMLTILAAFAQAESEGSSENAKLTYRRKFSNGISPSGPEKTFGYRKDGNGDITIDFDEAKTVRIIFFLAEQGIWPSKIKTYLNNHGFTNCTGGEWDDTGIFRILRNVSYKGDLILQKTYLDSRRKRHKNSGEVDQWYIADNHPAIITSEQWNAVQEILNTRSEQISAPLSPPPDKVRSSHMRYPLTNMLYCPYCGAKLIHKWSGKTREYWACKTNLKVSAAACRGIWLPAAETEGWDITEPITVVSYEDEYDMQHFTAYPKSEYETSEECPYRKDN